MHRPGSSGVIGIFLVIKDVTKEQQQQQKFNQPKYCFQFSFISKKQLKKKPIIMIILITIDFWMTFFFIFPFHHKPFSKKTFKNQLAIDN